MAGLNGQEARLVERAGAATMLAQVEAWSAINSGTANLAGLETVAARLADAFAALPGEVTLVEPAPVTRVEPDGRVAEVAHGRHLVVRVRPDAARRVLLTGHMDTVYPVDHSFQATRWIADDVLGGPGVADMKGGIAIMLAALRALEEGGTRLGYDVLINSDEETGSASSAALIAELARDKVAALTYEPAARPDGTLAGARPGSGNLSLVVTGRAAHAGRNPEDGRNAVLAAAALAIALADAKDAGLSVNPARIDGGGPNNVVPDHAVLRVNLRPRTPADQQRAEAVVADAVARIAAAHEVAIHVHGGFGRPPKPLDARALALFGLIERCADALGQPLGRCDSGGVCDGNNIAACGVPVVDTMGARGGAIHSPDEYLIVSSLADRAALSALALHRLEQGDLQ